MSMIIQRYDKPIYIDWAVDAQGNKQSVHVPVEEKQVVENRAYFVGIPDESRLLRVKRKDTGAYLTKIGKYDTITAPNQFSVNYESGFVAVDKSLDGKVLVLEYYSRGVLMYPAERIYRMKEGNVVESLQDIADGASKATEAYGDLNEMIITAAAQEDALELDINAAGIAEQTLEDATADARNATDAANASKAALDASKNAADATKAAVDASKEAADASKVALDNSKDEADASKDALDASKVAADTSKENLDASKLAANLSKAQLDASIDNSVTKKSELDVSITEGIAAREALDASKIAGDATKAALDASKEAADTSKANIDISKEAADASKVALDASKVAADQSKVDIDASIATAIETKDDLDQTNTSALQIKSDLNDSISTGTQLKTDLDDRITTGTQKVIDMDERIEEIHNMLVDDRSFYLTNEKQSFIIGTGDEGTFAPETGLIDIVVRGKSVVNDLNNRNFSGDYVPTAEVTTQANVFKLPDGVKDGYMDAKYSGFSWNNLANNGVDYANWWLTTGVTKSSSGINIVCDGTYNYAYLTLPRVINSGENVTVFINVTKNTSPSGTIGAFLQTMSKTGNATPATLMSIAQNTGVMSHVFTAEQDSETIRLFVDSNAPSGEIEIEVLAVFLGNMSTLSIDKPLHYGYNFAMSEKVENLLSNGVDYGNWTIVGTGGSKSSDGLLFASNSGTNLYAYAALTNIKPSTVYTIVYEVYNNTSDISGLTSYGESNNPFTTFTMSSDVGIHNSIQTSNAVITNEAFFVDPGTITTGEIGIRILAIIEGNATNLHIDRELELGENYIPTVVAETSHNANLLDSSKVYNAQPQVNVTWDNDTLTVENTTAGTWREGRIYVTGLVPNEQITLSCEDYTNGAFIGIKNSDSSGLAGDINITTKSVTFTVPSNGIVFLRFIATGNTAEIKTVTFVKPVLRYGTATTYEPYKESVRNVDFSVSYPHGMAELPSGENDDSEFKRVSNWYTLQDTDFKYMQESNSNYDVAVFVIPNDSYNSALLVGGHIIHETWEGTTNAWTSDDVGNIGKLMGYSSGNREICFGFNKGTSGTEAKTKLVGTRIRYKLAMAIAVNKFPDGRATLPNGISDDDEFKRVSDNVVINGSENWSLRTDMALENTIVVEAAITNVANYGSGICNLFTVYTSSLSALDIEGLYYYNGTVRMRIKKSRLISEDLSGVLNWLGANKVVLRYQLATPISVDPQIKTLDVYTNGSYSAESNAQHPVKSYVCVPNEYEDGVRNLSGELTVTGANLFSGIYEQGHLENSKTYRNTVANTKLAIINVDKFTNVFVKKNETSNRGSWALFNEVQDGTTATSYGDIGSDGVSVDVSQYKYLCVYVSNTGEEPKLMVNVGTAVLPYTSHQIQSNAIPVMRSVGSVYDEYDCNTGVLTKRVGEIIIDGSDGWGSFGTKTSTYALDRSSSGLGLPQLAGSGNGGAVLSNYLQYSYNPDDNEHFYMDTNLRIYLSREKIDNMPSGGTKEGFKEYLDQNPLIILYPLAQVQRVYTTVPKQYLSEKGASAVINNHHEDVYPTGSGTTVDTGETVKSIVSLHKLDLSNGSEIELDIGSVTINGSVISGLDTETWYVVKYERSGNALVPVTKHKVPLNWKSTAVDALHYAHRVEERIHQMEQTMFILDGGNF